ncbi:MAG: alpha-N-acetylglucosaminidase [Ferruginibacter sp.]
MKVAKNLCFAFLLSLVVNTIQAKTIPSAAIEEVTALINRVAPGKAENFVLELMPGTDGRDSFFIESQANKIYIKGTNGLALSKGFNYYLNNYCHTTVSWYLKDPIVIPQTLPAVTEATGQACRFEKRFFLNYCTFGYTMLWWQWNDWQRLIDWMALNGINMPLAITGQEYIWQKVYKKLGMSEEASRRFFTGPSHLPWQRMGNLDRWLGPLPQAYIDGQFELQKQILKRERGFGMKPILPAFAGHVPYDLKKIYPAIKLTDLGSYETGAANDAYFLDPMDPLFIKIQKAYLAEQTSLLGTDHLYGADPFNEMDPPSWEPNYLAKVAENIYTGMKAIDKEATWIQMGWTFYYDRKHWTNPRLEAMIKAVPANKMIILDYFGEFAEIWRGTDAFFKAPYVWCYLGNFGGNTQLAAPLLKVSKILSETEKDPNHRQLAGIGTTLEGFGVNDFMFDWIFDYAWNIDATNTTDWITKYAASRSGHNDPIAAAAWLKMLPLVYNTQVSGVGLGNMMQMKPKLKGRQGYSGLSSYDYKALANILPTWLLADDESKANKQFQRDLAMVEKQVLVNLTATFRDTIAKAYYAKDEKTFKQYTNLFLSLCDDVDKLAGTQNDLLLGHWIGQARDMGKTDEEKNYYEKSARVLITTRGGENSELTEYAGKDWAGLIESYYKKRWELFFNDLSKTINTGEEPDMKAFDLKRAKFDWDWANSNADTQKFDREPKGNTIEVCNELYKKWVAYL